MILGNQACPNTDLYMIREGRNFVELEWQLVVHGLPWKAKEIYWIHNV